jgi:hypothetical protein
MLICLVCDVRLVLVPVTSSSPSSGMLVAPSKLLLKSKILSVQSPAQSSDALAHSDPFQYPEHSSRRPCCCFHAMTSLCFWSPKHHAPVLAFGNELAEKRPSRSVPARSTPGSATLVVTFSLPPSPLDYPPSYLSFGTCAWRGWEFPRRRVIARH